MQEIWKEVKGFEDYYEVSNLGNVRSKTLKVTMDWFKSSPIRVKKGRVLSKSIKDNGYEVVTFYVKKHYQKYVHRLVAETFIGEIPIGYTVNHKDSNKKNNILTNLEIISYRENSQHYFNKQKKSSKYVGVYYNKARRKYVAMIRREKGDKVYLGGFENEEDARVAYNNYLENINKQ